MKPGGHPIGLRLSGRMAELRNRLSRARYFRGHGVHSPFVYTIVREVFMRRELLPGDRALYGALLEAGVSRRRAVQLQNLAIHCGYATFGLDRRRHTRSGTSGDARARPGGCRCGAYRGGAGALRRLRTAGIVPAVGRGAPFDIGG